MIRPSLFLRRAILGDAVVTGATGLLLAGAAGLLGELLNLPVPLLRETGLFLLVYAAAVGYLGTRPSMPKLAVWAVIAINALWTVDSLALLLTGWVAPNGLGIAFIVFQAVTVGVIAELQLIGLRRSESTGAIAASAQTQRASACAGSFDV